MPIIVPKLNILGIDLTLIIALDLGKQVVHGPIVLHGVLDRQLVVLHGLVELGHDEADLRLIVHVRLVQRRHARRVVVPVQLHHHHLRALQPLIYRFVAPLFLLLLELFRATQDQVVLRLLHLNLV